jgi:DNA-binding CsgD family transcriptional regulator
MTEDHEHQPASHQERRHAPLLGRGALVAVLLWGLAVLVVTAGIAGETVMWPLVPLFGAAVPALLVVLQYRSRREAVRGRTARAALAPDDRAEREVLEVLADTGELTPTGVATRTSLTVFRASEVLERLAGRGHLEVVARDGFLAYSLPGGVRRELGARAAESAAPARRDQEGFERASEPVEPLDEPLSEREREMLGLLAAGKTNREVAAELYVAPGTVKAHVASIYRKLDVHNRAEMLNRARALGLLGPSP